MFNLIMRSDDWSTGRETMPIDRLFAYTDNQIVEQFSHGNVVDLDKLARLPCLFMPEGTEEEICHVGQINRVKQVGREIAFEYTLEREVPPLKNSFVYANRLALDMPLDSEFSRNHWAVKGIDLYRFLLGNVRPRRQRPTVFEIPDHEKIEPVLTSAMMPFDATFNAVYETIRQASSAVGLKCRRADDIWENAAIIQDVVSLIDRSRIVVCDCSGRNPNVFYEVGIAHTLGREVILIAQSEIDVPFDLRHLRYIRYLNNAEGRANLLNSLQDRMQTLLGH